MKKRSFNRSDFSTRFNNWTLKDLMSCPTQQDRESEIPTTKKIKYQSLREDFVLRMLQQKTVTTNRYVWHVADYRFFSKHELDRYSIAKEGLKCSMSDFEAIFANNNLDSLTEFFPFICEIEAWKNLEKVLEYYEPIRIDSYLRMCDFWRIDTRAFQANWHSDPNVIQKENDPCWRNYICTATDIPSHALKLYKVFPGIFLSKLSENMKTKTIFPVSLLQPVDNVNNWIKRQKQAA